MSFSRFILGLFGWKVNITVPDYPKVIICVAPHTSNWDFVLGKLSYASVGRKAGFLMKSDWFFFPFGALFRAMGGIPVNRKGGPNNASVDNIVHLFQRHDRLAIAITPEGTRSRTAHWRTGFLSIAHMAEVPIVLGVIDAATKSIIIERTFIPTGDNEADLKAIKQYYSQFKGIHPENFTTD